MAIGGIASKVNYFEDEDFVIDDIAEPKYYREVPAKKVNKAFNIIKSEPTKQIKKESVMTPIPSYIKEKKSDFNISTSTGNANVLVNEIARLLDDHLYNEDVDFEIKVKANEDETKWLVVNYDVIKALYDTIKDYID